MTRSSHHSGHSYKPLSSGPSGHGVGDTSLSTPLLLAEPEPAATTTGLLRAPSLSARSHGDVTRLPRPRLKKSRAFRWLVLHANGEKQVLTLDKRQLTQVCKLDIPIRDMRLMDAALGGQQQAPSQLLVRDNALVFSMEHVRLIITYDKVVVPLDDDKADIKERFVSHLEMLVAEWALHHSAEDGCCGAGSPIRHVSGGGPTGLPTIGSGGSGQLASSLHGAPSYGNYSNHLPHHPGNQQQQQQQHGPSHQGHSGHSYGGGAASDSGHAVRHAGVMSTAGSDIVSLSAYESPEHQPFELHVLEAAVSEICSHLSREVGVLHEQVAPAMEALMRNADTNNLEAARRIKTTHMRLEGRVKQATEALERLMEDDTMMMRMCLSQQAQLCQAAQAAAAAAPPVTATPRPSASGDMLHGSACAPNEMSPQYQTPFAGNQLAAPTLFMPGTSVAASYARPHSLVTRAMRHSSMLAMSLKGSKSSALGDSLAEAAAAAAAAASNAAAAAGAGADIEIDFLDVENLLESYYIIIESCHQQLQSMSEYIEDTEDLINIQLDFSRNKLIRFDILLTTGTFAIAFFNIVTGILGENLVLPENITQDLWGFVLVNGGAMMFCICTFITLVLLFKAQKVL